jgi:CRISPR-associated protein Csy1
MNQKISEFFVERKTAYLKAKIKPSLTTEEETQILADAEDRFCLSTWLPDAAKRASQLSMVSHPSKFSHPSAKTSSVIAKSNHVNDGYLRSGNIEYELDVFGNAAAMDVFKFLSLKLEDDKSIFSHLEEDSSIIKLVFTIPTASYESLKNDFLSIKKIDTSFKTDHLIKQVYFPVNDDYHLLSVLTPSGLLTLLKTRVDNIRFSDETKTAKEYRRKNEYHALGYDDLFDLTVTGFGGTQPQNVSVLNSQNAGRAYLLSSTPPKLKHRDIRLPNQDFFKNSLRPSQFKDSFQTLHSLMIVPVNNVHLRNGISNTLKYIIDQVLQRAFKIRSSTIGWSNAEHYQFLPLAQRIWLDDEHISKRQNEDEWINQINRNFARWILQAYEFTCKDSHIKLSDHELHEIRNYVDEALANDQEFFR